MSYQALSWFCTVQTESSSLLQASNGFPCFIVPTYRHLTTGVSLTIKGLLSHMKYVFRPDIQSFDSSQSSTSKCHNTLASASLISTRARLDVSVSLFRLRQSVMDTYFCPKQFLGPNANALEQLRSSFSYLLSPSQRSGTKSSGSVK